MTERPANGATPPEQHSGDNPASHTATKGREQLEWWQQPGMPFDSKPTRLDNICIFGIMAAGIYGLALMPFRVWLLANAPWVAIVLTGSVPATVSIGAEINSGQNLWPIALLIGALSVIKFDWLFWLAGRLWGERVIDWFTGGANRGDGRISRTRRKVSDLSHRLARRWAAPMILLTYVPLLPVPQGIIFATLGMGHMRLRTFMLINFGCALLNRGIYIYLGYRIGLPVLEVIEELNRYALWIGLATTAVIFFVAFRSSMRAQKTADVE